MKELIKIINFYKERKISDIKCISSFIEGIDINYYTKPTRTIKTNDFIFTLFAKKINTNRNCPLCFENIYTNKYLKIIPIKLQNRYFFIQPSPKQYVSNHLVIIDFVHTSLIIDDKTIMYFYDFIKQFPSFTITSNNNLEGIGGSIREHIHYQAGIMDMPIFHRDATYYEDDIYLVDWYLTTFLIKSDDITLINEKYLYILKKYQNEVTSFNPVMFIRNEIIHLYLIVRCAEEINIHNEYKWFKEGIGVFEAMGLFILNEQTTPINIMNETAKLMLTYQR